MSQVLKALRRKRGLRPSQVAAAMGMPLRSYEHFEAGRGRLNVERVSQFAVATDSDPFAIMAAVALGAPDFAVRSADSKLMLVLMLELEAFNGEVGDDIARLSPRTLFAHFRRAFQALAEDAHPPADYLDVWRERGPGGGPPTGEPDS